MTVTNNGTTKTGTPPNGVVYVKNGTCTGTYDFNQNYDTPTVEPGCAETYVRSKPGGAPYSKSFTIASANDIVVDGSLLRDTSTTAIAGLIADGFVRVYHPVNRTTNPCTDNTTGAGTPFGVGALGPVEIDAA